MIPSGFFLFEFYERDISAAVAIAAVRTENVIVIECVEIRYLDVSGWNPKSLQLRLVEALVVKEIVEFVFGTVIIACVKTHLPDQINHIVLDLEMPFAKRWSDVGINVQGIDLEFFNQIGCDL